MSSDPIRAALERLVELDDGCTADHWHAAITAARAALDAATEGEAMQRLLGAPIDARWYADLRRPAAPLEGEPSDQELRDLWSWSSGQDQGPWPTQYHCFARAIFARWGRPAAPPAPLEGEVGELVAALRKASDGASAMGWERDSWVITRAAALLSQLSAAAPAVVPVAVSERLPERGDCDAEGRCWRFHPEDGSQWNVWSYSRSNGQETHWLSANAIPLPTPQGGEGQP